MRRSYAAPRRQPGLASQIVQHRLQQRHINGEPAASTAEQPASPAERPLQRTVEHSPLCANAFAGEHERKFNRAKATVSEGKSRCKKR